MKIQVPTLLLLFLLFSSCNSNDNSKNTITTEQTDTMDKKEIDWQGHRGARGLLPENTIPSFIKGLEYNIKTLELDVVVSKDSQVIVSHEPWFSHHICSKPNGEPVTEKEEKKLLIYEMTYEEIKTYDCGSRGNPRFPEQQAMKVFKPSFMEVVSNVALHCKQKNRSLPYYNVELKSQPNYYGTIVPEPAEFVRLMLNEIKLLGIHDKVNLQSFDFNILKEIRKQDPKISMAMLVENIDGLQANLDKLGFTPPIYSPYYMLLNEEVIKEVHAKGMRLIPWTVNDPVEMKKLTDLGVDGIITDYPNRIPR